MEIKYSFDNDRLTFKLIGELDEHYAKGVKEYIESVLDLHSGIRSVVFDMSALTFMDSTGIGMLLGRYKKLSARGVKCYIEQPTISVEKVLYLAGIYDVMPKI